MRCSPVSGLKRCFGTRKGLFRSGSADLPALSGRARTKWMMLSVMSCSPEVMKRFTPVMCHVPSGWSVARVVFCPTSDPASGSVRTIVAPHWLSTMVVRCVVVGVFRGGEVWRRRKYAEYRKAAGFAPSIISASSPANSGGDISAAECGRKF